MDAWARDAGTDPEVGGTLVHRYGGAEEVPSPLANRAVQHGAGAVRVLHPRVQRLGSAHPHIAVGLEVGPPGRSRRILHRPEAHAHELPEIAGRRSAPSRRRRPEAAEEGHSRLARLAGRVHTRRPSGRLPWRTRCRGILGMTAQQAGRGAERRLRAEGCTSREHANAAQVACHGHLASIRRIVEVKRSG